MTHYQLVESNKNKSWLIIGLFVAFVAGATYLMVTVLGYGLDLVGVALIFSGLMSLGSYWWSDKIILTISGARPASREEFFDFYTVAENLAMSQRLPKPK